MSKEVKRIRKIKESIDISKVYSVEDAVKLLVGNSSLKFTETLDLAVKLGVNPQRSDQIVRGVVQLPNGTGKDTRVAVFARGDKAQEAQEAGADIVGAEDLVEQIEKGIINFDKCIATPDMMAVIGRVARILGPKGLMPNAKLGSVTVNLKSAVQGAKAGQVEFRAEKNGIVHAGLGKLNFKEEHLVENVRSFFDALLKSKPSGVKGSFFIKASLSSTMGVGLRVDLSSVIKI